MFETPSRNSSAYKVDCLSDSISTEQFPLKEAWPKNLSFHAQSILDPFPEEDLGTYDLVGVRAFAFVLAGEQWQNAVKNLITLLKPGGYLQWIDGDMSDPKLFQTEAGASRAGCLETNEAWMALTRKTGRRGNECFGLKNWFVGGGLVEVGEDVFSTDRVPEVREAFTKTTYFAIRKMLFKMEEMGVEGWSMERAERVAGQLDKELEGGKVYITVPIVCVIGKRLSVD